jgi:hypothetical protein
MLFLDLARRRKIQEVSKGVGEGHAIDCARQRDADRPYEPKETVWQHRIGATTDAVAWFRLQGDVMLMFFAISPD